MSRVLIIYNLAKNVKNLRPRGPLIGLGALLGTFVSVPIIMTAKGYDLNYLQHRIIKFFNS
jgi:hypothetical protein